MQTPSRRRSRWSRSSQSPSSPPPRFSEQHHVQPDRGLQSILEPWNSPNNQRRDFYRRSHLYKGGQTPLYLRARHHRNASDFGISPRSDSYGFHPRSVSHLELPPQIPQIIPVGMENSFIQAAPAHQHTWFTWCGDAGWKRKARERSPSQLPTSRHYTSACHTFEESGSLQHCHFGCRPIL